MHTIYKTMPTTDIHKMVDLCKKNSVKNGGIFEVYPGTQKDSWTIIVNKNAIEKTKPALIPLGVFYINFAGEGVLSLEDEDPDYDGMPSTGEHAKAVKKTIDRLLAFVNGEQEDGRIRFDP